MSEFKSWSELSPLEQAACTYSDFFKESYGFRPRMDTSSWTLEDFDKTFEEMAKVCKENAIVRETAEAEAIKVLEARIASLMQSGAVSRATAIRWIGEAENSYGDMEYLCFLVGIPYNYFKEVA